jgi:hypothetical protein
MFFKKKPFVRFVNLIPGIESAHPVIRTNEFKFNWLRNASLDFKERLATASTARMLTGVNRCPGILQYLKQGFIVTAPIDFTISTDLSDPGNFRWTSPSDFKWEGDPYIGFHSPDQLSKFVPIRDDTLSTVVKVNTFWRINSSPDIIFLQLPIAYPDHNNFTAVHGIIDCEHYVEINVQMFWHRLNDTVLIKAGTPLCQLIPIPRNLITDLIVEPATEHDYYVAKSWKYLVNKEYVKDLKHFLRSAKKLLGTYK